MTDEAIVAWEKREREKLSIRVPYNKKVNRKKIGHKKKGKKSGTISTSF